ncbi:MAG: polyphosphate kinase 1, partial [Calditrichia bacterium]
MAHALKKYINREISWLSFNARVLQEAADPEVPLIERIKFLGIFSSNLDEFYSVRVGTLRRMLNAGIKAKAVLGGTPKKILAEIQKEVLRLRAGFDEIFSEIQNELKEKKIFIINEKELNPAQEKFVHNYFNEEVRPRLVPIMLSSLPKFPYLKSQVVYLAIYLKRSREPQKTEYALIEVPVDILPRFIVLPPSADGKYLIMLDDVIRFGLKEIFSTFDFDTFEAYTIKLTRDAELDIEYDITKSFFEKISKSIKRRELGHAVRFVYDREIPEDLLNFILTKNHLTEFDNLIPGGRYHNAKDFMNFPNPGKVLSRYKQRHPLAHKDFSNRKSLFHAIREKDILLHYPYQSFHYVIDFLREAAIDPKVKSIKMTLYRVAKQSNVINALINACRNGKEVTVVMELQARFDEEANIYWTKKLEEEGARIIDGVPGLKVHAKLILIARKEDKKTIYYANISTGNFNESTAKIYSDDALFTADKHIPGEVNKIFEFLENNYKTHNYKHLLVSPFDMRKKLNKLIKNEIKNAKAGEDAYILVKLNSLVDREMIDQLYRASQAGVKIRMIIRGICSLIPGVKGLSENIEVISIIDKYLEHSRIFIFCNGGKEKYYISSADWMIRNLDNRVEAAVPIYNKHIQKEIKAILNLQFRDNKKARIINKEQDNAYRRENTENNCRAQDDIY